VAKRLFLVLKHVITAMIKSVPMPNLILYYLRKTHPMSFIFYLY